MRAYIYSVVCMAAIGGIVLTVSPEGVKSGIKKHMRLICSLCMLCVMISPVSELLVGMKDIGEGIGSPEDDGGLHEFYESIYEDKNDASIGDGIGNAVKSQLYKDFSIPYDQCRVSVEFADSDGDGFREPRKITVILSGSAVFKDPRPIEKYVSGKFGCECVCAIE